MKKTLSVLSLLLLSLARGQGVASAPTFEVASITPSKPGTPAPPGEHAGMVQFTFPGGRFSASATTLKFLLEWAYGIQPEQHVGGPSWLETDRYDIVAKAAGEATDEQMRLMVQSLLAERFKLKLHHESRKLPAYVISPGKTPPRVTPAKEGEIHNLQLAPKTGGDPNVTSYRIAATRFSLDDLCGVFARQLDRVLLNQTGLRGEFDFTLELTPDAAQPDPRDPSLLLGALRDLGFTVKAQDVPVDVLILESAEKVAAGNE